jgi:glycogen debranching enzyme
MALSIRNKRDGWALEKIKARFWYADPMFASIFADHLAHMSDLAKIAGNHSDQMDYELLAKVASEQIQSQLWQPGVMTDPGIFRVLDTSGKPVPETTITSISPVILRDLAGGKLADIVRLYRSKFDTKFPIPSVAITSPNYDPGYQEKLIMWRGPTWIWMNYLVARGLFYHYNRTDIEPALAKECQDIATKIFVTSRLLTKNGYHEHYNPETGEPQRTRNFAGSALGQLSLSSFTQ